MGSSRARVRARVTLSALLGFAGLAQAAPPERQLDKLSLPAGFKIEVWADGIENARSLTLSPRGIVYVGTQTRGKVYAVAPAAAGGAGRDGRSVQVVADGLTMPNGVAWRDGALYVAEVNRVLRYDAIDEHLAKPPQPVVVAADLPSERHHGWKFIAFGPDGYLYVPVGAPCNICDQGDPYATLLRMDPKTGKHEVFARGIRNTVGFDWHPRTGELWFTDNGRDLLGDDLPPDELNRAPRAGLHFGFPFCHGGDLVDAEFGERGRCADVELPARALDPHVAAIGMRFYRGEQFPERYRQQIFIAEHGSWNRSDPIGYRVTVVHLDDAGRATDYEVFAQGWLQGKRGWGRPVDLQELPDGSLLLSDDLQGVLYRIHYVGGESPGR